MRRIALVLGLAAMAVFALSGVWVHADRGPAPDAPDAIGPVDCATFVPPIVAYDTSKGQLVSDAQSFLDDLVLDGFSVGTISGPIPSCVNVLIIRGLIGTVGLPSPYTSAEAAAIKSWADAGHGLMLSSDWGSLRAGPDAIFAAFGHSQGGPSAVTDPTDFDPIGGTDWVIYQSDNFAPHAIFEGVASIEFLRSAWLSPTASAVITSDANSLPARVPVMAALTSSAGCAVLSTDSDWMANAVPQSNAGYFKRDNDLMARQTVSWLYSCGRGPIARPGGPYTVTEGSSVTLNGAASSDPNGDPLTFAWDLDNDGQYDDAFIVNPVFSAALRDDGVYSVSLRVSDGTYFDVGQTHVTVLNVAPSVSLTATSISTTVGAPITFTGAFADPGVLDTHIIRWNFGDGSPNLFGLLTRTHAFAAAGTYTVALIVTDDDGGVGSAVVSVQVTGASLSAPTANAGGPYTVHEGSSIVVSGAASSDPNGLPLTFAWDLDNDGAYTDAFVIAPTFSAALRDDGVYTVSLRVSNGTYTDTASTQVTVLNVAPLVSLNTSAATVNVGQRVTFTGAFTDPGVLDTHTLVWNFDSGIPLTSGVLITSRVYTQAGQHGVALTVTDDDGGLGQAARSIMVLSPQLTPSTVFLPAIVVFRPAPPSHTFLPVVMRNFCARTPRYADIVLVIDRSGSMQNPTDPNGLSKLDAAKAAATHFLNQLLFPGDQAALVQFNHHAEVIHGLSSDRASLIASLQTLSAGGTTRIDLGLASGRAELTGPRHLPDNVSYVILLTDGVPNGSTEGAVLAEAAAIKALGITIFTIGLGGDVNGALLQQVATAPDYYYASPSTADLNAIYERIAGQLRCIQ